MNNNLEERITGSRIYQSVTLELHAKIKLDEKASHHLARVLRAKVQDKIILFNGEGGEFEAEITQITKKFVEVEIIKFHAIERESSIDIFLAQGIARGEKMDFIVQKAVELGVKKIFPLVTERGNVRITNERVDKRLAHWQAVVRSACEQSGRNQIPEISLPCTLQFWLTKISAQHKFVLTPNQSMKISYEKIQPQETVALLIGPEGGLTDEEINLAINHGFLPISLGPRVLRTETATIAGLAVFQALFGDMVLTASNL